jgi:hypothetical protein
VQLLLVGLAGAVEPGQVQVGGHAAANARLGLGCELATFGDCGWLDFHDAAVAGGWVDARFGSGGQARLALDLRAHGPSAASSLEESGRVSVVQNTSLKLQDAYVSARSGWFEASLGAQRVQWGSADGFNPVDIVNPYDLEDPTRFDRRLATPMLRMTATRGLAQLELAVVPWFQPALLPTDVVDVLGDSQSRLELIEADGVEIGSLESRVELPQDRIADVGVGARFFWGTRAGDLALSAFHGRDSLPQVGGELRITGYQTNAGRVDMGVPILYPRIDMLGAEWRRDVFWDLVAWGEVAVIKPEQVEVQFSQAQLESLERLGTIDEVPDPVPVEQTQDGQVFARWVLGVDRSIGQVYVNLQWLHGFPTERKREDLRDYGMLALRWSVRPAVALDLRAVSDGRGVLAGGDLTFLHADTIEWRLGGLYVAGPEGSALGAFRGVSHLGTGAKVVF